jgi:hypothetical protein
VHNRYPSHYNIADKGEHGWYAQPLYYGLQFVRKALGDNTGENVEITSIETSQPDVAAYAIYSKEVLRNIVVLSMQKYEGEGNSQPHRNVSLIFKDVKDQTISQPLHVWALTAPSVGPIRLWMAQRMVRSKGNGLLPHCIPSKKMVSPPTLSQFHPFPLIFSSLTHLVKY